MTGSGHGIDTLQPSPRVSLEVIDRIVELALLPANPEDYVKSFSAIKSFSLASSTFRNLALRHYMRTIISDNKQHWFKLYKLLEAQKGNGMGGFPWVKAICASSQILLYDNPEQLKRFTHLETLSLDFCHEGLSTQYFRISRLCRDLGACSASMSLTSLTITSLPRIDIVTLQRISNALPELLDLYLSCTERLEYTCCWLCFEESLGSTIHSPIPSIFPNATSLGHAFAKALGPLTKLTHLYLGIFLSDEMMPYKHMWHCSEMADEMEPPVMLSSCILCEQELQTVETRESVASCAFAEHFNTLQTIGWGTLCRQAQDRSYNKAGNIEIREIL